MKLRTASLALLAVHITLAAAPTLAQEIYNNGPTDGNTDAWNIGFGFAVSNSFTVAENATVTSVNFAMWLAPGDTMGTADLLITPSAFGGTPYFNQTVGFAQGPCSLNTFGFDVCNEAASFAGPLLTPGAYWLELQNGRATNGEPVYWDENSGPSSAYQCCGLGAPNAVGTIPSESFTVYGNSFADEPSSSAPESSGLGLLASGFVGLAALLRRRLF